MEDTKSILTNSYIVAGDLLMNETVLFPFSESRYDINFRVSFPIFCEANPVQALWLFEKGRLR